MSAKDPADLERRVEELDTALVAVEQENRRLRQKQQLTQMHEAKLLEVQRIAAIIDWEVNVISGRLECSEEAQQFFGHFGKQNSDHAELEYLIELIHPEDRPRFQKAYEASVDDRQPQEMIHRMILPDGVERIVNHYFKTFFGANGMPLKSVGLIQDVTELKRTEALLEDATSRANEANQAKSSFMANMSHEIRTPMNAIIGYSEMLMEEAEEAGNEEALSDLKKINGAGAHLLALINDVLDLSKIEAGKTEIYLETFGIPAMIDDVVATIDALVKKNDNQLKVEVDPSLGDMRADLTKVRQALFNLLSNAAKFTRQGEIGLVMQGERGSGVDWVRMAVSDSGIGIPPEKLDHVFEEFSQADETTTRDYGGTGLGLTISRRFCQMMGGDITVESTLGKGSTFTIRLPIEVEQPAEESE